MPGLISDTAAVLPVTQLMAYPAAAAEFRFFGHAAFARAQTEGRPVLIGLHCDHGVGGVACITDKDRIAGLLVQRVR